jgi:glycosyltransferase involved in cell wall biosynthesis
MKYPDVLVTIGLPVYNGENFLRWAINSILQQTHVNFELIISDNASTDKTAEICQQYLKQDSRIKYFRNNMNIGAAENYNIVVRKAKGKYFKWAAHDDAIDPSYIEKCIDILENNLDFVVCYSQMKFIDIDGNEIENISNELFYKANHPSNRYKEFLRKFRYTTKYCDPVFGIIKTDILKKTKLIGNYPTSDMNLLAELILLGKFYEIDEYLFFRRKHDKMSAKAHASNKKRAIWFDPLNSNKILFTRWRWLYEFIDSVRRVPMNFSNKVKCYFETSKWAFFRARGLFADILYAGLSLVSRDYNKN